MFYQLEMHDINDIGTALCRLDDWQRSSVPLKTFEMSLLNGNLNAINSFMNSTKSGVNYLRICDDYDELKVRWNVWPSLKPVIDAWKQ